MLNVPIAGIFWLFFGFLERKHVLPFFTQPRLGPGIGPPCFGLEPGHDLGGSISTGTDRHLGPISKEDWARDLGPGPVEVGTR